MYGTRLHVKEPRGGTGTAWPSSPALPAYLPVDGGAPPWVRRGFAAYTPRMQQPAHAVRVPDDDWTPMSWATAPDPVPAATRVGVFGGARPMHALPGDSIYRFRRLDWAPGDPMTATPANNWNLNPYADNFAQMKEFHDWQHEQTRQVARQGYEDGGAFAPRPDRNPGLSTQMARTALEVPQLRVYPRAAAAATPSMRADADADADAFANANERRLGDVANSALDAAWATRATTEAAQRGWPAPSKAAGAGTSRGRLGGTVGAAFERADWAHPHAHSTAPAHVFY